MYGVLYLNISPTKATSLKKLNVDSYDAQTAAIHTEKSQLGCSQTNHGNSDPSFVDRPEIAG